MRSPAAALWVITAAALLGAAWYWCYGWGRHPLERARPVPPWAYLLAALGVPWVGYGLTTGRALPDLIGSAVTALGLDQAPDGSLIALGIVGWVLLSALGAMTIGPLLLNRETTPPTPAAAPPAAGTAPAAGGEPGLTSRHADLFTRASRTTTTKILFLVWALTGVPVFEELFRVAAARSLTAVIGVDNDLLLLAALAAASAVWVIGHVPTRLHVVGYTAQAVVYSLAYVGSGTMWTPVVIHAVICAVTVPRVLFTTPPPTGPVPAAEPTPARRQRGLTSSG